MTAYWDIAQRNLVGVVNVSEVLTAFITALMMEAVITSETSVNFYETPRGYHLHIRRCENLNFQFSFRYF
jgi:hypothetical protein